MKYLFALSLALGVSADDKCECPDWMVGDGECDVGCNSENCEGDEGDCSASDFCAPYCPKDWLSDGECDFDCNVADCQMDGGDCDEQGFCARGCQISWIGDGECDPECNVASCQFDSSDCSDVEFCSPGCVPQWLGDGECDYQCFTDECNQDNGDCSGKDFCAAECLTEWIGDGECDAPCNTEECQFDNGDCHMCSTNCVNSWIGDGECDVSCNIESCHFDGGDCTDIDMCADGCIESWIGDGECDVECYNSACNEDGGDCELDPADDAKPCECTGQQNGDGFGRSCKNWDEDPRGAWCYTPQNACPDQVSSRWGGLYYSYVTCAGVPQAPEAEEPVVDVDQTGKIAAMRAEFDAKLAALANDVASTTRAGGSPQAGWVVPLEITGLVAGIIVLVACLFLVLKMIFCGTKEVIPAKPTKYREVEFDNEE